MWLTGLKASTNADITLCGGQDSKHQLTNPDITLCGWLGSKHQLANYGCCAINTLSSLPLSLLVLKWTNQEDIDNDHIFNTVYNDQIVNTVLRIRSSHSTGLIRRTLTTTTDSIQSTTTKQSTKSCKLQGSRLFRLVAVLLSVRRELGTISSRYTRRKGSNLSSESRPDDLLNGLSNDGVFLFAGSRHGVGCARLAYAQGARQLHCNTQQTQVHLFPGTKYI